MPFLPDLPAKIKSLCEKLRQRIPGIPRENRRLALICAGGGAVLLLAVTLAAALLADGPAARTVRTKNVGFRQAAIPPEELFLPDEPDFLPGVLLGRERRSGWTVEDAAGFWQDPLKNGEEQWRERVETAIDELLERVP